MKLKRLAAALLVLCLLLSTPALQPPALAAAPYYIAVDITNQIVTVYENGNRTESGIVRQMICSTGKARGTTPVGTFTLPKNTYSTERKPWYYFPAYKCYAMYATRIRGHILFHSIPFKLDRKTPIASELRALGSPASHGCVRLLPEDAKFIAKKCLKGTKCRIYYSGKLNRSLRKKLLEHGFSRDEQTYGSFLADGNDSALPLKKGSLGALVEQLEARLKALGYYGGNVDGLYTAAVAAAVERFETATGRSATGATNQELWDAIFAGDAPAGMYVTLSEGMSGPAVAALQENLKAARFYTGAADGSFSAEVRQAVADWQRYAGQAVNGKATAAQQQALAKLAAELAERFPDGRYGLFATQRSTPMARTKAQVKLYKSASFGSAAIRTLSTGKRVRVVAKGNGWTQVTYGGATGYIRTARLSFYTAKKTVYEYCAIVPNPPPAEENAAEEVPGVEPAPEPAEIPDPVPEPAEIPDPALWAQTGAEGLTLDGEAESPDDPGEADIPLDGAVIEDADDCE